MKEWRILAFVIWQMSIRQKVCMTLNFSFTYLNSNDNFVFFLNFYAQKSGLEYTIVRENRQIILSVSGDEDELLAFADTLAVAVPHSVFLSISNVVASDEIVQKGEYEFKNSLANITPRVINAFKNGKLIPCENSVFSDICVFVNDEFINVNESNFYELLSFAILNLEQNRVIKLKDNVGEFELLNFSELSYDFTAVIPTNLKNLPKIFIADENVQVALASYEKPAVRLKTNVIYRQNHKDAPHFFDVVTAREIFTYALCEKFYQNGINFIALKTQVPLFKTVVLESGYLVQNAQMFYKDSVYKLINNSKEPNLTSFYLAQKELELDEKGGIFRIFLSKFRDDEMKIYRSNDNFDVINLNIPLSFQKLFRSIEQEHGGDRLLNNYSQNFTLPNGDIDTPQSFFALFCIIGVLLNFDNDFKKAGERLMENAMDFNGIKGVRVDFKMSSKSEFDTIKLIRSVMSFRLAGVDNKILSYGIVESFVHFLSDICYSLQDNFKLKDVLLSGSLFESKTLANLTLKHLKLNMNVKFSSEFSLEEMF
ncbi:hypothetical protein KDE12_08650 [Campylobacter sp. faydin G-105]|uniref:hypothetical protein n=1 Tax=Campylobacter anatolicus TaxID=2829105 RepID=UPI001B96874C|nr:hypothetical protein [Campylobacter anatolicus]MBR8462905.1 hypothetical protein [Campylobacter anatolicus]